MTSPELLRDGYRWTTDRALAITGADLGRPTPCSGWRLEELLEHCLETLGAFAEAVGGPRPADAGRESDDPIAPWAAAFSELAERTARGWSAPGALDRTYELPFATMPGGIAISANLLEVVVHGWDIGQATGEAVEIPASLAGPILAFAERAIGDEQRGAAFGTPVLAGGPSASPGDRLVAFLGRTDR